MQTEARAMVMLSRGVLRSQRFPVPDGPPPRGAIVEVLANGICGSDWDLYSGRLERPGGDPVPFPIVPGHEPVVRIADIDPAASEAWGVAKGDRVAVAPDVRCGECVRCVDGSRHLCQRSAFYSLISADEGAGLWGGLADHMVLRAGSTVFPVADNLSDVDATLFNPWGNAFDWTLNAGGLRLGDRVLVLGPGQRGLGCAVAAHEGGARQVILTGLRRDAHKLEIAPAFGAAACIDAETNDVVEVVHTLTDGEGVDLVVDTVPRTVEPTIQAMSVLRPGGTLVVAGVKAGTSSLPIESFRSRRLRIIGVSGTTPRATGNALQVLATGRYPIHLLHSHSLPLEEAEQAIRLLGGETDTESAIHVTVVP